MTPALRTRVGEPFSDGRLDADVATIEEAYRRRGFAAVRAPSAAEPQRTPTPRRRSRPSFASSSTKAHEASSTA
jgi:outer membrane protein assembly factor BamA